ncbi:aldo/keto reductase [Geothrix fuzhouensis]|uniref:aldo/keto reductase n=1 Tax=Geothrix fuzhouensis TaxID=2966451 RepID=UPI00214969D7|nr:aldo/keto reductase [Geothrix fuzhouensis]
MGSSAAPERHFDLQPDGAARLALGTMRLLDWRLDPRALAHFLAEAADAGVGVLDTADIYGGGEVEPALGAAFREAPGLRDRLRLVGKCGIRLRVGGVAVKHYDTSRAHVTASVDRTLRCLGTDHLDLLLLHRPDPLLDPDELAGTFADLRDSGRVRSFGLSNFQPAQADLLRARLSLPLVAHQVEASLWHPDPVLDGTLEHASLASLVPMAWSPLGGGRPAPPALAAGLERLGRSLGLTPAQVALAWLARHPAKMMPVLGTGRIERIREGVAAMATALDREVWFELLEAATGHAVP